MGQGWESKIPTSTSFVSSGIDIFALSADDNRLIPFVDPSSAQLKMGRIKEILGFISKYNNFWTLYSFVKNYLYIEN
jgi:hypothetical protein